VLEIAEVRLLPEFLSYTHEGFQLYVKLYPEMLARSQSVGTFVKKVWELVGGGKQLGIAYDQVFYPSPSSPSSTPYMDNS
jgi:hypothetical protein